MTGNGKEYSLRPDAVVLRSDNTVKIPSSGCRKRAVLSVPAEGGVEYTNTLIKKCFLSPPKKDRQKFPIFKNYGIFTSVFKGYSIFTSTIIAIKLATIRIKATIMERIRTNIVELKKLYAIPCETWLLRFTDGKLDAHQAFRDYGEMYGWLYENSPYDLIGWEIDNNRFDWDRYSWAVAKYCPENLNDEQYNWKDYSHYVAVYCPERIDPERYNWRLAGWAVRQFCSKDYSEYFRKVLDGQQPESK